MLGIKIYNELVIWLFFHAYIDCIWNISALNTGTNTSYLEHGEMGPAGSLVFIRAGGEHGKRRYYITQCNLSGAASKHGIFH